MADQFDEYREALIMETTTIWPAEYEDLLPEERVRAEAALHGQAQKCTQIEYVRTHTGFCRQITVTPEDAQRVGLS